MTSLDNNKEKSVKKLLKTILSATLLSTSLTLNAQDLNDIALGHPGYAGSGCPRGSVSTTLSPDKKSLSILFDEFVLEAGPMVGKTMDRKNCNIAVPVHVPNGFSVSVMAIDYRGYNFLPRGARSQFSVEYFFAGQQGPRYRKTFMGMLDQEYLLSNKIGLVANVWSRCGEDVNLRVSTSMRLLNRSRVEDALSTVDSADMTAGIVYKLQYKRCNQVGSTPADDFEDDWGSNW